jgi:hypothetical protein
MIFMAGFPGVRTLLEHEREQAARKLAQDIRRARMGLYPQRKAQRGKIGYWWRYRWRLRQKDPLGYDLRKMHAAIQHARAEGRL